MPRNGSGTYSLPAGNPVVSGTTIESSWANTTLSDIGTAMTDSLSRSGQGGMTAAFRAADGTSSVPGIAWSNETGSGFYRAGTNDVRFVIGTSEAYKVTSTAVTFSLNTVIDGGTFVFNESGADKDARFEGDTDANLLFLDASTDRVGIGIGTPGFKLDVAGGVARLQQGFQILDTDGYFAVADKTVGSPGNYGLYYAGSSAAVQIWTASNLCATFNAAGNVGIGTNAPTFGSGTGLEIQRAGIATLRLENSSASNSFELYADNATDGINLRGRDSSPMVFWTGNTERVRIGTSGQIGIGGANYGTSGQVLTSQGSGAAPVWANPSSNFNNTSLITSSGSTFTVPAGVATIRAYVFGKGGNGVGTLNASAAGGGGGSCTWGTIPVTPGDVFTFDVTGTVASLKKGATTYLTANAGSNGSGATGGAGGAVGSVTGGLGITDSGSNAGGAGGSISGGAAAGGGGASGSPVGTGGSAATVGGGNLSGGGGWGGSGSGQGGGGGAGGAASGYAGGGAGGAASGSSATAIPGRGRDISNLYTDVLLRTCTSPGAPYVANATIYPGPGGGGAFYFNNDRPQAATGGFGAGGGAIVSSGAFNLVGGAGGFGGGGGGCYQQNTGSYDGTGGAGGIGGGGGGAVKDVGSSFAGTGGAGGSAAVLIFY